MRGFSHFTWLGHDVKHTHHAHVREMHVIDRHHAWADRSRSFGFPQPRFGFGLLGTFVGGCVGGGFPEVGQTHWSGLGTVLRYRGPQTGRTKKSTNLNF